MTVTVDTTQLRALAASFEQAGSRISAGVRPVVSKGALNIKNAMRSDMAGSTHFGQVANVITYDIKGNANFSEAQIGPETEGAVVGDLGHFAYFGGAHGGGGSVRDPQEAANDEAPKFEEAIGAVIGKLL